MSTGSITGSFHFIWCAYILCISIEDKKFNILPNETYDKCLPKTTSASCKKCSQNACGDQPQHAVPIQDISIDTQGVFSYAYLIKKRFYKCNINTTSGRSRNSLDIKISALPWFTPMFWTKGVTASDVRLIGFDLVYPWLLIRRL